MTKLKLDGLPKEELPTVDDFAELFINDVALIDVRAPVEFAQGSFPYAVNIPLMNDKEREAVGIRYKEQGQDEAILLGAELVNDENRKQRTEQWIEYLEKNGKKWGGVIFCFRGGLRSQISQQWVFDKTGQQYPRVQGGYKAMRRFLIDTIEKVSQEMPILVIGGRTGSGKTRLLKQFDNSIDLEGLANHRGSAFGPTATPQPTQINFENALAIELLKKQHEGHSFLIIEDEARNVGSIGVPQALFEAMKHSPIVKLEVSESERNKVSIEEYILDSQQSFDEFYGKEKGFQALSEHLHNSLNKIQKRLGGVRYKQAKQQLQSAIENYQNNNSLEGFIPLVTSLLTEYYDPMYDYQISKKQDRVIYSGSYLEISSFIESYELN